MKGKGRYAVLACLGLIAAVDPPPVAWIASPNYANASREATSNIDTIVLHTTEGSYAGTISWFQNPSSDVSAHYVIQPNGQITQMVLDEDIAWHATYYNSRSIGIECVGYASQASTWTPALLDSLSRLCAWLCQEYDIPLVHPGGNAYDYPNDTFAATGIVGHNQVQPWNRSDPGPYFPWSSFIESVRSRLRPPAPTGLAAAGTFNGAAVDVTFSWNPSPEANGYWLDLALSSADLEDMTGSFTNYNTAQTTYEVAGLAPGTTYYWRVYAYNGYGGDHGYPPAPYTVASTPSGGQTGAAAEPVAPADSSDSGARSGRRCGLMGIEFLALLSILQSLVRARSAIRRPPRRPRAGTCAGGAWR